MSESIYLQETVTMDFSHPVVSAFVEKHINNGSTDRENAVSLYYAVRDSIRYTPYNIDLTEEGLKASTTLEQGHGWCVSKALLLAACCRAARIQSRLGYADVKNHMSTKRLRDSMQTDIFYWHGYTEILIEGGWIKATPAFNLGLCEKFGIAPLEFNGTCDSIFHPFDKNGNQHMEYLNDRGHFDDLPLERIMASFKKNYPRLKEKISADFEKDAGKEDGLS